MADEHPTTNSSLSEKGPAAELAAGFLVGGGRFSLVRELGRGGMGRVWLAHDERLMSSVALKFLSAHVRAHPVALKDLRLETKKSRLLSHPNIIRIYDLYEAPDEVPFLSMEFVEGASMWILRSRQPQFFFTWDYLRPIVKQLCEALDYAHTEGVIHRDLKPANMLVDERQRLRLADFGIAAWISDFQVNHNDKQLSSGTPAYMSPQQIEGQPTRVTDDIYALGATLYELLSGHTPFYENDIVYQVCHVLPTPLADRLADLEVDNAVPPAVAAMIMSCLAKDPEKRPQSTRAVAEWIGLTDAASHIVPVVFAPPGKSEPAEPPAEPEPPPPDPVNNQFAFLGVVVIAGLVAWLAWGRATPKAPVPAPAPAATNAVAPPAGASNAAAVAATPAAGGASVTIDFSQNIENGLQLLTGVEGAATAPAKVAGIDCRALQGHERARCFFQIGPAFKRSQAMNARVQVEYYAGQPGVMQILFDGSSRQAPRYSNGGKTSFDRGGWKTADFQLNDARFRSGQRGGGDFCLVTSCPELYLRTVTVFFDE